jgi:excisionase family DNA binding protein
MNGKYPTLDLKEAANFLRISPATAQKIAAAGELPGAKIGRAWVFLLDDLIEWLREQVKILQEARKEQKTCQSELPPLPRMDRKNKTSQTTQTTRVA